MYKNKSITIRYFIVICLLLSWHGVSATQVISLGTKMAPPWKRHNRTPDRNSKKREKNPLYNHWISLTTFTKLADKRLPDWMRDIIYRYAFPQSAYALVYTIKDGKTNVIIAKKRWVALVPSRNKHVDNPYWWAKCNTAGQWVLPGGGIAYADGFNPPEDTTLARLTALREFEEETGVALKKYLNKQDKIFFYSGKSTRLKEQEIKDFRYAIVPFKVTPEGFDGIIQCAQKNIKERSEIEEDEIKGHTELKNRELREVIAFEEEQPSKFQQKIEIKSEMSSFFIHMSNRRYKQARNFLVKKDSIFTIVCHCHRHNTYHRKHGCACNKRYNSRGRCQSEISAIDRAFSSIRKDQKTNQKSNSWFASVPSIMQALRTTQKGGKR